MGKRNLKEQYKDLNIDIIDLINRFDPSGGSKYTSFLTKMLKNKLDEIKENNRRRKGNIRTLNIDRGFVRPESDNHLEDIILQYITEIYGDENMQTLISFHKHVQENRMIGKDINSYSDWYDIMKEVSLADLKQSRKLLEKEIQKVIETDDWLIIKPLTMEASLTYGSGTKWCTASRHNKDYFYRYSRNGVLCYAISKVDGDKFGIYYDFDGNEFSIWNTPDRRIDSIESSIPSDLMSRLYKLMKNDKRNYEYFSDLEKLKCDEYYQLMKVEEPAVMMPDNEAYELIPEPHSDETYTEELQ